MFTGLFVGAVLCTAAEPEAPKPAPEAHRDALARYGAAVLNAKRERLITAVKQLHAVADTDPDATEPLRELARLYTQLGRDLDAVRTARKAVQKDPNDHESALLLARLLADLGEPKDASAAAKLALECKSLADKPEKAVRAFRELAVLCEKGGDYATAETALAKAVDLLTVKRAVVVASAAFTPKEADAEAADCLERLGKVRVKREKFDAAVEAFDAAAKLYADKKVNDPAAAARLAWNLSGVLQAKDEPAEALKHLEQFLKLQPRTGVPYERLAKLLRAAGRTDDIAPELRKYASRDKQNAALAAVLAAELARSTLTRAEADEMFAKLTNKTVKVVDPEVIAIITRSHFDNDRPVEIIKDLDRAFALLKEEPKAPKVPDTVEAADEKARAGEKARAYADAIATRPGDVQTLLRAAAADLRSGNKRVHSTYFFLGALAAKHDELKLAALQFREAAQTAPPAAQWDAYTSWFQVLRSAHNVTEIETVCRRALAAGELNGFELLFNFHLALALAEQGADPVKAAEALKVADKLAGQGGDLNKLTVVLRRHAVLCALGKWDEAIDYGKKLLEEFDAPADRTRVRHAQVQAYSGAKKHADSEATLRTLLDDDPDDTQALNALGYQLADQGRNLDEAERLVRHALAVDRIDRRKSGAAEIDNAIYRDSLGWVLFRKGQLAEAKAELEKAAGLAAGAVNPEVWDHLGDVLFRLNEKTKAKQAWEKAKELYEADARTSSRGRRDGRLDEVGRKLKRVP